MRWDKVFIIFSGFTIFMALTIFGGSISTIGQNHSTELFHILIGLAGSCQALTIALMAISASFCCVYDQYKLKELFYQFHWAHIVFVIIFVLAISVFVVCNKFIATSYYFIGWYVFICLGNYYTMVYYQISGEA